MKNLHRLIIFILFTGLTSVMSLKAQEISTAAEDSIHDAYADFIQVRENSAPNYTQRHFIRNVIGVAAGPAFYINTFYSDMGEKLHVKNAYQVKAYYNHISESGIGFGIRCNYFNASHEEGDMEFIYAGPSFVGRQITDHWVLKAEMGFGVFYYDDSYRTAYKFGIQIEGSVAYRFTKHFGVVLGLESNQCRLPKKSYYGEGKPKRLSCISITGGLEWYF
ncbi:hypothetical protein [uncultured Bacteroides sp.]|uniref:hypothetical protein n=1 Tax=uncultured Bacteroides sp. TaxID=162156 RepID=UPI0026342399|nr:hypothetical protein [uncultured Bacteroides sp.]